MTQCPTGRCTPCNRQLCKWHTSIQDVQRKQKHYELHFKHLYQYYSERLIPFTNGTHELIVKIPILTKHKTRVPMSLYPLTTVPVLADMKNFGEKQKLYNDIINTWIHDHSFWIIHTSQAATYNNMQQDRYSTLVWKCTFAKTEIRTDMCFSNILWYGCAQNGITV